MTQELLIQNIVIIGAILLGVYYLTLRARRRKALAKYEMAYAYHAEAMANADEEFKAAFGAALPQNPTGKVLVRFSLLNRAKDKEIKPEDFATQIEIHFPSESAVLYAKAVDKNGAALPSAVGTDVEENRVIVYPFALPERSSVIFNIIVDGSATPFEVLGSLHAQDQLEPLS